MELIDSWLVSQNWDEIQQSEANVEFLLEVFKLESLIQQEGVVNGLGFLEFPLILQVRGLELELEPVVGLKQVHL